MEFSYFMPVRLLFGANVIDQLGATAKSYGTHALIVTGRSSTKRSGLLDRSIALLEAAGVRATVFNKVEPNPLTTTVMEGAALAREQGCDLVIGMGGGSMMDAAKAVAFCAVNGGDVNDYISGGKQGTGCLPILEVPTTCGTGSEANPFAVLTNPETKDKKSLWGDLIYPKVSFIDPELMKTMPKEVLASVGFDALSHNMEVYLATRSQPITDQLALHAIRLTAGSLPKVYRGEGTQEDWENITLASLLGGIVINTAGVGGGHGMEHPVSGMYNVVHGKGLAALTPPSSATLTTPSRSVTRPFPVCWAARPRPTARRRWSASSSPLI